MQKYKLLELNKIIEERIGSLKEEVEIGTNVKLNVWYIADQRDELGFLQWIMSIIPPILNQDRDEKQLGMTKERLEVMDVIEFENTLQERVQELKLKLIESNNLRESDIIINQKDTLESIWAVCLIWTRAIEIAEPDKTFGKQIG